MELHFFFMVIVFQCQSRYLYCTQGFFRLKHNPSVTLECTRMIFDVSLTEYEDLKVVASLLAVSPQIKHLVFILKVQLTQITKFISYNLLKNYPLII